MNWLLSLKSGEELSMRCKFISLDTLVLAQKISLNAPQIKTPLSEIQAVKVIKVNKPIVIGIGTVSGSLLFVILNSFVEGISKMF